MYYLTFITSGVSYPNFVKVDSLSADNAILIAQDKMKKVENLYIHGFSFFEYTGEGEYKRITGTYYLGGKLYTYPQVDETCKMALKSVSIDYTVGKSIILFKEPFIHVYPFDKKNDEILDIDGISYKLACSRMETLLKEVYEKLSPMQEEIGEVTRDIYANCVKKGMKDTKSADMLLELNKLVEQLDEKYKNVNKENFM